MKIIFHNDTFESGFIVSKILMFGVELLVFKSCEFFKFWSVNLDHVLFLINFIVNKHFFISVHHSEMVDINLNNFFSPGIWSPEDNYDRSIWNWEKLIKSLF